MTPAAFIPLVWMAIVVPLAIFRIQRYRAQGRPLPQAAAAKTSPGVLVIFGLIGISTLVGGVYSGLSNLDFARKAAHASGQIINFRAHRGSRGGYTYSPIVRYRPSSGMDIVFESRASSNLAFWPPVGAQVEVLYDASNPRRARLNHFTELWMPPIFLTLFGGIFLSLAIFISASMRKKQALPPSSAPPSAPRPAGYEVPNIIH